MGQPRIFRDSSTESVALDNDLLARQFLRGAPWTDLTRRHNLVVGTRRMKSRRSARWKLDVCIALCSQPQW